MVTVPYTQPWLQAFLHGATPLGMCESCHQVLPCSIGEVSTRQSNLSYRGKGKLMESMQKHLTKAARCAIRTRSSEPDRRRAVQLLQQDLRYGPLHCFGIHSSCSTDFCKVHVAQKQPTKQQASSPQMLTSPLSSNTMHLGCHPRYVSSSFEVQHEQLSVDTTALNTIMQEQEQAWQDAVDDTNLDAVRSSTGSGCTQQP